jgi:ATP synthase F1 gamma subunit
MGQDPDVIATMKEAVDTFGAGSGGTRNISGTTRYHVELEKELASLHGKESALLFTSGYVSNEATLSTLAKIMPNVIIYSDELNHASMIEGIKRANCAKRIFRHNDLGHLRALLENAASEQGSRMTAMDNATRNAGEMINKLTLNYNRTRQANITRELIEIISGAEAV